MKKDIQPVDQFFRDALKDHTVQPSETAKEAFLKEAAFVVPEKKSSGKKPYIFLAIGLLVLITGSILYFSADHGAFSGLSGEKNSPVVSGKLPAINPATGRAYGDAPEPTAPKTENHPSTVPLKTNTSATTTPPGNTTLQKKRLAVAPLANTSTNPAPISHPATTTGLPPAETPVPITKSPPPAETNPPAEKPEETFPQPEAEPQIPSEEQKTEPAPEVQQAKNSTENVPAPDQTLSDSRGKPKKSSLKTRDYSIQAGISYTPEWMFNTLEGDKFVNNFGVEGTFRYDRFSVRTGAGLSITRGTHEVVIGYNDYLGNYQQLDSIAFNWDENHYTLVPTYFTSDQVVYDSLLKQESSRLEKRYTYLQIPLILGYDFYRRGIFSLGVRTGPVVSILLSSKQLSGEYDPGKNRIVSMNDITPDRVQTNWQFMAGLNASLAISRRFSIELEPSARYYFNSVYEKSDINKKPWSVGVRAAFIINF